MILSIQGGEGGKCIVNVTAAHSINVSTCVLTLTSCCMSWIINLEQCQVRRVIIFKQLPTVPNGCQSSIYLYSVFPMFSFTLDGVHLLYTTQANGENSMHSVGFEPTSTNTMQLECTPLDRSGTNAWWILEIYIIYYNITHKSHYL